MRILIDTNIVIHREDAKTVPQDLRRLEKILHELKASILVHPASLHDLRRDGDAARAKIIQSKFETYERLVDPPDHKADSVFQDVVGEERKPNDEVDNALVYSVFRNAVDYLVTEDREVLSKAVKLSIRDRVLPVTESLALFSGILPRIVDSPVPMIERIPVSHLDIGDSFFDDLKADYDEFTRWFEKIARAGRECLVYRRNDGSIGALLIYKIEESAERIDCTPPQPQARRVKLSTLKVTETGYKIGELFIKMAVEFALANSIERIYLTHFVVSAEDPLISMISDYGFEDIGESSRGERVYEKCICGSETNVSDEAKPRLLWPMFRDDETVPKFLVPIQPTYHDRLFLEYEGRAPTLFDHLGFVVEGNAIGKAYLCHAKTHRIAPGAVILFYRSHDLHALTTIGVVEEVHYDLDDAPTIQGLVDRRTVYSLSEIEDLSRQSTLVLLFTWNCHLEHEVGLDELRGLGLGAPQSVVQISQDQYQGIMRLGGIRGRLTIH